MPLDAVPSWKGRATSSWLPSRCEPVPEACRGFLRSG